jgi:catechol 2,3-dioxygenase-like lactoylglutathione lyase family enzyme
VSIGAIDHVALGVPDLDARVELLVRDFALRLLRYGNVPATGARMAMLADADGNRLELVETPGADAPTFLHLAFRTPDVDAAHADALAAGLASTRPPHPLPADRARTALVSDGRGLQLQLIAYDGD